MTSTDWSGKLNVLAATPVSRKSGTEEALAEFYGTATRQHSPHHGDRRSAVPFRSEGLIIRTLEAVVDPDGNVRLLETVHLAGPRRALVTILDDAPRSEETALLTERALADWNRPEEDAAWSHLQPAG